MPNKILLVLAIGLLLFSSVLAQIQISAGSLDESFGAGGITTTDFFTGIDEANAIAIQGDGKIVVAGRSNSDFAIVRYNTDGNADNSFGIGGRLTTDFFGFGDIANAILIQPDGKILAAGSTFGGFTTGVAFALVRYNPDGSLDTSFGSGGRVATDFFNKLDAIRAIALQPDGKVVVAGGVNINSSGRTEDFALARYNSNGSLDTSFGSGGKTVTDFSGGDDEAKAVIIQPDRKIVAVGYANDAESASGTFAIARYRPDGRLDSTFGNRGRVRLDSLGRGSGANCALMQPDGKIVVAGYVSIDSGFDFGLVRLNADGNLDNTFGMEGKAAQNFFSDTDVANAVALQRNGKIVVAGFVFNDNNSFDFGLARFTSSGAADTEFGNGGRITVDFFNHIDVAQAIAIQGDGKIIVGGFAGRATPDQDFALARFESSSPVIIGVLVDKKRLIITGSGFEDGAKILINGKEQKSVNDSAAPTTKLIAKKAGKRIKPGDSVQVLNSDGTLSREFIFN